jgi:ABC-type uncharacterized transport system substrate-binding protein
MKRILALAVGDKMDVSVEEKHLDKVRPYIVGLVEGLAALGRRLGRDFAIDYSQRLHPEFISGQAFKEKEKGHDLIYAMSTTVMQAAGNHVTGRPHVPGTRTPDIPIVFANVSDPGAEKYVQRGLATGFSARRSQTADHGFECLLATIPTLKEVLVLHKKDYDPSDLGLDLVKVCQVTRHKNVKLTPLELDTHSDIKKKLSALPERDPKEPAQMGIFVLPVDLFFGAAPEIIELAHRKYLPTFFTVTDWVKPDLPSAVGGYGVPQKKCGERTAGQVNQILWGNGKAGAVKVMDAADHDFEWVVSGAAAEALKIPLANISGHPRVI